MNLRTKIMLGVLILFLIGTITVLAYGFFTLVVTGEGKDVNVTAAELKINFTDGDAINAEKIDTGWTQSKTFSVENAGDKTVTYTVNWKEYNNTFTRTQDLVYSITGEQTVPETEISNTPLLTNVSIDPGETHNYTITFTYKHLEDVNQNEDMGKTFSGRLGVIEGE